MNFSESTCTFILSFGEVTQAADCEVYDGAYTVTPKVTAQSLATESKVCRRDIQIEAIPYYEVENINHGNTVIIGG